jgi:hypothetical protein
MLHVIDTNTPVVMTVNAETATGPINLLNKPHPVHAEEPPHDHRDSKSRLSRKKKKVKKT